MDCGGGMLISCRELVVDGVEIEVELEPGLVEAEKRIVRSRGSLIVVFFLFLLFLLVVIVIKEVNNQLRINSLDFISLGNLIH